MYSKEQVKLLTDFTVLKQSYHLVFLDSQAQHVWYTQDLTVECKKRNANKYPFSLSHDEFGYIDGLRTANGNIEIVDSQERYTNILLEMPSPCTLGQKSTFNLECSYRNSMNGNEEFWEVSKTTAGESEISLKLTMHPDRPAKTCSAKMIHLTTKKETHCSTQPRRSRNGSLITFKYQVRKGYKIRLDWKW
jgi:hypothetical protein